MTTQDLFKEAFGYLNSYKRHRALAEVKKTDTQYNELQQYKMIDQLELALRAIQSKYRNVQGDESDDNN